MRGAKEAQLKLKRNILIEKLQKLNINHSKDGTSIYELEYDDLLREVALASFRDINVENEAARWF